MKFLSLAEAVREFVPDGACTALEGFTRIGRFGDRGHEAVLKQADGTTRALRGGFDHFAMHVPTKSK